MSSHSQSSPFDRSSGSKAPVAKSSHSKSSDDDPAWIWGLHSVEAALECCPELVYELRIEEDSPDKEKIISLVREIGDNSLLQKTTQALPRFLKEKRTQGCAALLKHFPLQYWSRYREELENTLGVLNEPAGEYSKDLNRDLEAGLERDLKTSLPIRLHQWAILDGIQDPRNYGAIIRSAAAFGVQALFVRDRHQSPLTGVVAQASAGNLFRLPIVECSTFNPLIDLFLKNHLAVWGLDSKGSDLIKILEKDSLGSEAKRDERPTKGGLLWLLGGEGEGLRPVLREKCTEILSIGMENGVESLNASAAATVAFFAAYRQT